MLPFRVKSLNRSDILQCSDISSESEEISTQHSHVEFNLGENV